VAALAARLEATTSGLGTLMVLLDEEPGLVTARRDSIKALVNKADPLGVRLRLQDIADHDAVRSLDASDPDVLLLTLEELHQLFLPHALGIARRTLQSLGLVCLVSASRLSTHRTAHACFILQRLFSDLAHVGGRVRVLATADQLENCAEFVASLLNLDPTDHVIATAGDAAPIPRTDLCFWVPPLIRRSVAAPGSQAHRTSLLEEARLVVAALAANGMKTVALGNHVRIGMVDNERQAVVACAERLGLGSIKDENLKVVRSIGHLTSRDFGQFDAVVCYGITEDWSPVSAGLRRLVRSGGGICVVTQPEPRGLELARRAPQLVRGNVTPCRISANADRTHRYAHEAQRQHLIANLPEGEVLDADERAWWAFSGPDASFTVEHAASPTDASELVEVWRRSATKVLPPETKLDRGSADALPLVQGTIVRTFFSRAKSWVWGREGAVVFVHGERLVVESVSGEQLTVNAAPATAPLESVPRIESKVTWPSIDTVMQFEHGLGVRWLDSVTLAQRHDGFWQVPESRSLRDTGALSAPVSNLEREITVSALVISGQVNGQPWDDGVAKAAAAALSQHLPRILWNAECLQISVVPRQNPADGQAVLIWQDDPTTCEPLATLRTRLTTEQCNFFLPIYHMVASCPCSSGCEGCLKVTSVPSGGDKSSFLRWLGVITKNMDEAESLISRRTSPGIADMVTFREQYNRLVEHEAADDKKGSVLHRLFQGALDVSANKLATIRFMTEDECNGGAIGLYFSGLNEIAVKPGMNELKFILVLGHEFAHCWQSMGGRWNPPKEISHYYGGKLLSEGFAEWVAYRLMGFYASHETMEEQDFRKHDEYGEGLDFFLYVEENYGLAGAMALAGGHSPEANTQLLLEKSGVYDRVCENEKKKPNWTDIFGLNP
jgi:hypothetical protein